MTPEERAREMQDMFYTVCKEYTDESKCRQQAAKCALVLVDELIQTYKKRGISVGLPFLSDTREALLKMV